MDSTTVLLTGNTSTMYAVGFLDLEKDGPTVIDLPPKMLGVLDDMEFHYMTDLGVAGPDKGKGGKFLVLPPGHKGDVPNGLLCRAVKNQRRVGVHARLPRQGHQGRLGQHPQQPEGLSAGPGVHPTKNRVHQRFG